MIKSKHIRRGSTSILEIVICLTIFSLVLLLLSKYFTVTINTKTSEETNTSKQLDYEFLLDSLFNDVKFCDYVECTDKTIEIFSDTQVNIYTLTGNEIYRNNELAASGVISHNFELVDNGVHVYLEFEDGFILDNTIYH